MTLLVVLRAVAFASLPNFSYLASVCLLSPLVEDEKGKLHATQYVYLVYDSRQVTGIFDRMISHFDSFAVT